MSSCLAHDLTSFLAASALPYKRSPPKWVKATPTDVADQIFKLARKGMTPSQIGIVLRDSHGIPQVHILWPLSSCSSDPSPR